MQFFELSLGIKLLSNEKVKESRLVSRNAVKTFTSSTTKVNCDFDFYVLDLVVMYLDF